ncbi:MAG: tetratricopeptide repeat protein [Nitrospirae bacterium]|nr:tetratricopeptide repeat protein [Nitrospirota bacterium]
MKNLFYIFLLFICLFCSCVTVKTKRDIQQSDAHFQLGLSYLNNNNIQPAFVEFQKAIDFDPDNKEAHNMIGVIYLTKLEDYSNAIIHFKKALNLDKNFSEVYNNLGNAYEKIGKHDEAIESYKAAIENPLYHNTALALYNIGMLYYKLARYDDAMDAFKESLKRNSDFYLSYYGLALCYNMKGQYDDAAVAISRAIELDPMYRGNRDKAIEDLRNRKIRAKAEEEKFIADYLEILKY